MVFRSVVASCIVVLAANTMAAWHQRDAAIMGTEVSVEIWHESTPKAELIIDASMAIFDSVDQRYSPYKPSSELSKLNQQAFEQPVQLSAELGGIVDTALRYSAMTQGAFDITYASVGYLYDYRNHQRPPQKTLASLKEAIDYRALRFDAKRNTLAYSHPECRIDLGGIAKGYAVDEVIAYLKVQGIQHAAVSAGGDTQFLGDKRGRPWMVGVQHPRDAKKLAVVLPMSDFAMSTSGDYERFYIEAETGQRVHHIINPKTGEPTAALGSVTVIGPNSIDTDALSTSVFVMGLQKGLALLESLPEFDGIIVESNGTTHYSSGLMPPEAS